MKKKLISCILSASMLCTSIGILPVKAEQTPYFTHQNVVGSQTCYGDDTAEKTIDEIPNVIQGMRINQPVFRTKGLSPNTSYTCLLYTSQTRQSLHIFLQKAGTAAVKQIVSQSVIGQILQIQDIHIHRIIIAISLIIQTITESRTVRRQFIGKTEQSQAAEVIQVKCFTVQVTSRTIKTMQLK